MTRLSLRKMPGSAREIPLSNGPSGVSKRASLLRFSTALSMILVAIALLVTTPASAQSDAESDSKTDRTSGDVAEVLSIRIEGAITTVTTDFIERALAEAEKRDADALLIELDTPGGSVAEMQAIGGRMLNSELPILVWVGPQGAQAASAGTFIVLAAHAAGMAPKTVIGAASPVGGGGEDLPETIKSKLVEDLAATARNYAGRRGDKASDWAEDAVRDAVSATADEALELGVIDAVTEDPAELLDALDDLEIEVAGEIRTLGLKGAEIRTLEMSPAEQLLTLLATPALALLLLTLGVNAILTELSNPGGYVAGLLGVLFLTLGLYSLGALEANLIGLAFIAAAFVFFALDIKTPSFGILTLGGVLLFVAGSVILFSGGQYEIPWGTIASLAIATGAFFAWVVRAALRAMRRQPTTGAEGLIGQNAELRRRPEGARLGSVLVAGELWDARFADTIEPGVLPEVGGPVRVVSREGFVLTVAPNSP